jgi:hypothetical protein
VVRSERVGPALIFERLWGQTGCQAVVQHRLAPRQFGFPMERAVFLTVPRRLLAPGSDGPTTEGRRRSGKCSKMAGLADKARPSKVAPVRTCATRAWASLPCVLQASLAKQSGVRTGREGLVRQRGKAIIRSTTVSSTRRSWVIKSALHTEFGRFRSAKKPRINDLAVAFAGKIEKMAGESSKSGLAPHDGDGGADAAVERALPAGQKGSKI